MNTGGRRRLRQAGIALLLGLLLEFPTSIAIAATPRAPTPRTQAPRTSAPAPQTSLPAGFSCLPTRTNQRSGTRGQPLPAWMPLRGDLATGPSYQPLDLTVLFERASRSVHVIVAAHSYADFARGRVRGGLGSAVAITPTVLVTNAHVIAGNPAVAVKIGERFYPAEVAAADPCYDRAVLVVRDAPVLTPIGGVRSYHEIQVGEAAYTIGTPRGLDRTLSTGIVSALRLGGAVRLVQTTAQISPGSSGGGLFDAAGNLIGITVGMISQHSQTLNFAVGMNEFFEEPDTTATP